MASKIVQVTDFQSGLLRIPGAISVNAGEGSNADLQSMIELKEVELLYQALGKAQGDEFYAALDDIGTADQHWQDLWNGEGEFPGIRPIAQRFIYCNWLRDDEIKYNSSGAGVFSEKNQVPASLAPRYVDRWNEFIYQYQKVNIEGYKMESLEEFIDRTSAIDSDHFVYMHFENSFGL